MRILKVTIRKTFYRPVGTTFGPTEVPENHCLSWVTIAIGATTAVSGDLSI